MTENNGPLSGLRVLEMGQLIAGPFTTAMLGYYGAEIIKIEPPEGDPIRRWRSMQGDTSLWWYSIARNKRSVVLDLRQPEARDIAADLACQCDILVENFRPGVMESWQLGPNDLKPRHPELIYSRISGYGQTGPYADKPGFASVCEGISGFRYLNGFPGEAPVRPNLSLGDSIASLHAVIGILMALQSRNMGLSQGQVIDVALFETMFNMLESVVPEYASEGIIREASGTTLTGIVPTNTWRCSDGKYVIIGGNGDSIFKRLMRAIGQPTMADHPALANNEGRVKEQEYIEGLISVWCAQRPSTEVIDTLEQARVPVGPIYNAADMFQDPHFHARDLFEEVRVRDQTVTVPAMSPKLSETPGKTRWPGPDLGADTIGCLQQLLGMSDSQITRLRQRNVIGTAGT